MKAITDLLFHGIILWSVILTPRNRPPTQSVNAITTYVYSCLILCVLPVHTSTENYKRGRLRRNLYMQIWFILHGSSHVSRTDHLFSSKLPFSDSFAHFPHILITTVHICVMSMYEILSKEMLSSTVFKFRIHPNVTNIELQKLIVISSFSWRTRIAYEILWIW